MILQTKIKALQSLRHSQGQALVQTLVSLAITGIVILAMITALSFQQNEVRSLSEKLAINDLQKTLTAALADGSVCQYLLNNPVQTFNATAISKTSPQTITLPTSSAIYASVTQPGNVLGPVIAKVGESSSAYSSHVVVESIKLFIDGAPTPLPAPGPGASFKGNWIINFDSTKLLRALKPASILTTLVVDTTNPTAAKITSCQDGGSPTGTCLPVTSTRAFLPSGSPNSGQKVYNCPTGYRLIHGGVTCTNGSVCLSLPNPSNVNGWIGQCQGNYAGGGVATTWGEVWGLCCI